MLVWKNLEDLQLATTGVVGGVLVALPFSSFNSYLLRKRKSEQKKLWEHASQNWHFPLKKRTSISLDNLPSKCWCHSLKKKMFKRIGIHPLQLESYPLSGSQCHLLSDVRRCQQRHGSSNMSSLHNRFWRGQFGQSPPDVGGILCEQMSQLKTTRLFWKSVTASSFETWESPWFFRRKLQFHCTGRFADFLVSCGKEWVT